MTRRAHGIPARVVDATGAAGGPPSAVVRGRAPRPGHNGRVTDPSTDKPSRAARSRMTGRERREQLIGIGRKHFADKGFEGATVEEIAASAGQQARRLRTLRRQGGLYAVVVDREIESLLAAVQGAHLRRHLAEIIERAALALLGYVETSTDGFRILVRDSPAGQATGSFASLMSDIASQVEHILAAEFKSHKLDPKAAPCTPRCSSG